MSRAPEVSVAEEVMNWARVSAIETGTGGFQEGKYARDISAKHPAWKSRMICRKIYQRTLLILREKGNDTKGGEINIRKWVEEQFGTVMGNNGEDWKSAAVIQWRLNLKAAVLKHVLVSPYEIFEHNGGKSRAAESKAKTTYRGDGKHRVVCNLEYNDPVSRGISRKKICRGGERSLEKEWGDRDPHPHVWILGGKSTYARKVGL